MFCVLRLSLISVLTTLELCSLYSFCNLVKDLGIWAWGLVILLKYPVFTETENIYL